MMHTSGSRCRRNCGCRASVVTGGNAPSIFQLRALSYIYTFPLPPQPPPMPMCFPQAISYPRSLPRSISGSRRRTAEIGQIHRTKLSGDYFDTRLAAIIWICTETRFRQIEMITFLSSFRSRKTRKEQCNHSDRKSFRTVS